MYSSRNTVAQVNVKRKANDQKTRVFLQSVDPASSISTVCSFFSVVYRKKRSRQEGKETENKESKQQEFHKREKGTPKTTWKP